MNINELGENLNMIDTVSRGIKKMFNEQWRRHFPMPDYEIDQIKKKVVVRIYGNEINKRYTDLLKTNDTLSLWDCISLDAVQKGRTIHDSLFYVKPTSPHHLLHLIIYTTQHKWWGDICFYHICGMRNAVFVLLWVCKKVRIFAMSIIKERNIIYKRLRRGTGDDKRCIALVA